MKHERNQLYTEEVIAEITLKGDAEAHIRAGNLEKGLFSPETFGDDRRALERVREYTSKLTSLQRGMLLDALTASLREDHQYGRSTFSLIECGYAIDGVGLELTNDTVTEDDSIPPEQRARPLKITFAVEKPESEY